MLKIRSFTSADLQISRVCLLCPGEVHKAGFPLVVLHCSARLGSRQCRISCGGSNTQDASWQTDLVVSLRECRCGSRNQAFCLQLKTKKFFYMTHNFTQSDSLQKAHSPPPPYYRCGPKLLCLLWRAKRQSSERSRGSLQKKQGDPRMSNQSNKLCESLQPNVPSFFELIPLLPFQPHGGESSFALATLKLQEQV